MLGVMHFHRWLLLLVLALPVLAGCMAGPLDPYKLAITAGTAAYQATDATWARDKAAERDACLAPPTPPAESPSCVERVIAAWAARSALLKSLYAALHTADLALEVAKAQLALGKPVSLAQVESAAGAVLDAVQAIQAVK